MSVDAEFATVDLVLASDAETHGIDAFALALIKAERQMRKLFTYLVFQSDAFTSDDVQALRTALAARKIYFRDFVFAWNKLWMRPLEEIIGSDYDRLKVCLTEATEYRNKFFHGQLTKESLSREDLVRIVSEIKRWCSSLAGGAQAEIGYDGFGRNSFRKSFPGLADRLLRKINSIKEYEEFLLEMEKSAKLRPPFASHHITSSKNIGLYHLLVEQFPRWVAYFESKGPFRKAGQLEFHLETIRRRRELGSGALALADEVFQRALYNTLRAWGIGSRGSRLKPFNEFAGILHSQQGAVAHFEAINLEDPLLDVAATADSLWTLLSQFPIVENNATLVPVTKALHHVLPDLVVPMDREYTQVFFGWQNPRFQYSQRACFMQAFTTFISVARTVKPSQYVGKGWNSSGAKVIDNALIGLLLCSKDQASVTTETQ